MPAMYSIESLGHHDLPPNLASASDADVEDVLRGAVAFLGLGSADVQVMRVSSVIPGSCIACTDVVAYVGGVATLVARPRLY